MRYPTPDDPGRMPIWDVYVMAQATAASRGGIPVHALAYGVEVDRYRVRLRFQMSEVSDQDEEDMVDTVDELERLVGPAVTVDYVYEIRKHRLVSPSDGVWWIFLARVD